MNTTTHLRFLDRLLQRANTFSRLAIWVAGALTLASALYITFDVIVRKTLGFSFGGSDELSGYAFAISISWALSFATLQRANIRIDTLYQKLPTRLCAVIDWVALVGLGIFIAYVTKYATNITLASWTRNATANTTLGTPLWIPQSIWLVGLIWFCVVLAVMLLRATTALITGDLPRVRQLAGIRSLQEEADAEAVAGQRFAEEN